MLFRGVAEADIRREIAKRGFVKGIIGLPANLFYGTGIPACIVVVENAEGGQFPVWQACFTSNVTRWIRDCPDVRTSMLKKSALDR